MLRTLSSFGIFTESSGRRFSLTAAGRYLRSDVPDSLRGYMRWVTNSFLFRNYADLMYSAQTAQPAVEHVFGKPLFSHLQTCPELSRIFNDGMTSFSQMVSTALLEAYDFSGIKVIADLGGGQGALLQQLRTRGRYVSPHSRSAMPSACCEDTGVSLCRASNPQWPCF